MEPRTRRRYGQDMSASAASSTSPAAGPRVSSIDILRGLVMALMAIDHVRVFAGVPAGGAAAGIFLTRWVTHFCAPVFVFLAGTSAYLYGRKHDDLSRHLLVRGALLILLELTVIRCAWTFNLDFAHYALAGVIWAIGWSMIVLAGLVRLPRAAALLFGVALVAGHNLGDARMGAWVDGLDGNALGALWKILYIGFFAGPIRFGEEGPNLIVLYSLVPWMGVMALGYASGSVLELEPARRRRTWLALGLAATAAFLVLRGFELYGEPRGWRAATNDGNGLPPLFAFLETSKYPASLQFLLMTLGPALALLAPLEHARGLLARALTTLGRATLFFYLLHIPLIHLLALGVSFVREGSVSPWLFANHPMGAGPAPEGFRWSLGWLYAVWAVAMVLLWLACRWFVEFKARRRSAWLRYL
jgi:uncharacterized membrane protein